MQDLSPIIIDEGDRFKDNIKIVEEYLKISPTTQVALTNGEFIEKSLMSGFDPILFTGKENVPSQIADYLKNSDFTIGVLVGSDLVGAATNIRRTTGISVIVKFAQGARNPSGPIAAIEGLDLFYLTTPILKLSIHSARYNKANSQIEITYKRDSNVPTYFQGTISPKDERGPSSRVGDIEPIFISPQDFKTVSYPDISLIGESLSANVFTLYGEASSSLEKILEDEISIDIIDVIDKCEIEAKKVIYSKPKQAFLILIENIGNTDCWADVELKNIIINSEAEVLGSESSVSIPKGKTRKATILQELTDEDLQENPLADLTAYYGEKEDSLVKVFQGKFTLEIQNISTSMILIILSILIVIILIILIWKRRKNEQDWSF